VRVLVVGGAGGMGRCVVRTLHGSREIDEIVVADRDANTAAAIAELYSSGVRAAQVDTHDAVSVEKFVASTDIVVNAAGPFFKTGAGVLDAAIRHGRVYIDVDDDPEPTLAALRRHEEATRSGAVCVIGLGASPGVTNLLACVAAQRLDSVREVVTAWNIGAAGPPDPTDDPVGAPDHSTTAAFEHFYRETTGSVLQLRDGAVVDVAPLQAITLELNDYGVALAFTVGHPEAVTLQRRFPSLRTSTNAFFGPEAVVNTLVHAIRTASVMGLGSNNFASIARDRRRLAETPDMSTAANLPLLAAIAVGDIDGEPARQVAVMDQLPPSGMAGATGVPAAVGVLLAARGVLPRTPGVFTPEEVVPVPAFFAELRRWLPNPQQPPYHIV
jgi:saccharopine dehydrogenase-like NADP-dependent oxidoreductase